MSHYHANAATLKKLGAWFDYLREQNVYDNTKIILVSDHGMCLDSLSNLRFGMSNIEDGMWYNALLMVKDFNRNQEIVTDDSFMTNADTPTLAFHGLIADPVNPFTGKNINNKAKQEKTHHIFYTKYWNVNENNGKTFLPGYWFGLHGDNIFDINSWEYLGTSLEGSDNDNVH